MNIFNTNIKNSNDIKCHTLEVDESIILPINSIDGISIKDNTITGDKIIDNTITGDKIIDNTITGAKIIDNTITGAKIIDNSITGAKLSPQLNNNQLQALADLGSYDKIFKLNPISGAIVDSLTENQVIATKKFNSLIIEETNPQLTFTATNNSSINMNSTNDDTINFKSAFQIKHSSSNPTDLEFRNIASDNSFFKYNLSTNTFAMGINAATNLQYTILNLDADGRTIKLPNCNNAQQTILLNNLSNGDKGCMTFNTETNRLLFWDGTTFHQISGSIGLGNHSYLDTEFILAHVNDLTKKINFNLNAITTGITRTITMPDKNINLDDFVTKDLNETISGQKTFVGNNVLIENNRLLKLRNDFTDSFHSISYQPAGLLEAICLAGSDSSTQTSISSGYFTSNNSLNAWNDKFSVRFSNNTEPKLFLNNQEIFTDYQTLHSNVINSNIRNLGLQNSSLDMNNNSINNISQLNNTTSTELSYLNNVTSDIQTQLNDKIGTDSTNTLTNKTISGSNNTITNIGDSSLSSGIDATKIGNGDVTNTRLSHINTLTENVQTSLNAKVDLTSNQLITGQKTFQVSTSNNDVVIQNTTNISNPQQLRIINTNVADTIPGMSFENTGALRGIYLANFGTRPLCFYRSGLELDACLDQNGFTLWPTTSTYKIDSDVVLSKNTLGSGILNSSLQSLGVQSQDLNMNSNSITNITNLNGDAITNFSRINANESLSGLKTFNQVATYTGTVGLNIENSSGCILRLTDTTTPQIFDIRNDSSLFKIHNTSLGLDTMTINNTKSTINSGFYVKDNNVMIRNSNAYGIQVHDGTTNSVFGYRDLLGVLIPSDSGSSKPTFATYIGVLSLYRYAVGKSLNVTYHIPHDFYSGSNELFLHAHLTHNQASYTGTVSMDLTIRHIPLRENVSSPSSYTTSISMDLTDLPQYKQQILDVVVGNSIGAGGLLNTTNINIDDILIANLEVTAVGSSDPFIIQADLHYQTRGVIATNRTPPFYD